MTRLNRFCLSQPLLLIHSLCFISLVPALKLLGLFSSRIRFQLRNRRLLTMQTIEVKAPCYLIFCSSAGEYEQAKPMMRRLSALGYNPVILFFSASGYLFAQKKGELAPFVLTPIDSIFTWTRLFKKINPRFSIIVRHEIWPAFVYTAAKSAPLYLINYARRKYNDRPGPLQDCLLQSFKHIFTVSREDLRYLPQPISLVAGDTKYDRVIERANEGAASPKALLAPYLVNKKALIIGSAWPEDVECVLGAVPLLAAKHREALALVIVPHDLSGENLRHMEGMITAKKFNIHRVSQNQPPQVLGTHDVLLVDVMGHLAELYREANFCFVGGAMHHRVHNALEPAVYNLAIAFGPHYQTQKEAVSMADEGLATVCKDPEDVAAWVSGLLAGHTTAATRAFVESKAGASDTIARMIAKDLGHE